MTDPREFWRRKISTDSPHLIAPVGVRVPIRPTRAGFRAASRRALDSAASLRELELNNIGQGDEEGGWSWTERPQPADSRLLRKAARDFTARQTMQENPQGIPYAGPPSQTTRNRY